MSLISASQTSTQNGKKSGRLFDTMGSSGDGIGQMMFKISQSGNGLTSGTYSTSSRFGLTTLSTGVNNGGTSYGSNGLIFIPGAFNFKVGFEIKLDSLPTDYDFIAGFGNTNQWNGAIQQEYGSYFLCNSNNSNWQVRCQSNSAIPSTTKNSGIEIQSTSFIDLSVEINKAATVVSFLINDTTVATITETIPQTPIMPVIAIYRGLSATAPNRKVDIDSAWFEYY